MKSRLHLGKNKMCSKKKKRLIIKVSICEQSKLSNSVATGKIHSWLVSNSLKCQEFSAACHWLLMVVSQTCLAQLEPGDIPQLRRCISSVQSHASCALQTQGGKSSQSSSWGWAPSPGIAGRDGKGDSQTPPRCWVCTARAARPSV